MQKQRTWVMTAALLAVAVMMMGIYWFAHPKTQAGQKNLTISVVHAQPAGTTQLLLETQRAYLGDALLDEGIIAGKDSTYGLYVLQVDGETADESRQQWWCITKDGQPVDTGISATPIADGDRFELTLKTGY